MLFAACFEHVLKKESLSPHLAFTTLHHIRKYTTNAVISLVVLKLFTKNYLCPTKTFPFHHFDMSQLLFGNIMCSYAGPPFCCVFAKTLITFCRMHAHTKLCCMVSVELLIG